VYAEVADPTKVGLSTKPTIDELHINDSTTQSPFNHAWIIYPRKSPDCKAKSYLHARVHNFYELAKEGLQPAFEKVARSDFIAGPPKKRRKVAFTTVPNPVSTPLLNDETNLVRKSWLEAPKYNKLMVYVQVGLSSESCRQAHPTRGVKQLITMFDGNAVIVPVPCVDLEGQDANLWIQALPSGSLDKYPAFVLEEGGACLIPFGSIAFIVALPGEENSLTDKSKAKKQPAALKMEKLDVIHYTSQLIFDSTDDVKQGYEKCQYVSHEFLAAANDQPNSLRSCEEVTAWRELLGKIKPCSGGLEEM